MGKHVGTQTVVFDRPPVIVSGASVVGPKEGQGPLASYFDEIWKDEMDGEKSWEKVTGPGLSGYPRLPGSSRTFHPH